MTSIPLNSPLYPAIGILIACPTYFPISNRPSALMRTARGIDVTKTGFYSDRIRWKNKHGLWHFKEIKMYQTRSKKKLEVFEISGDISSRLDSFNLKKRPSPFFFIALARFSFSISLPYLYLLLREPIKSKDRYHYHYELINVLMCCWHVETTNQIISNQQ